MTTALQMTNLRKTFRGAGGVAVQALDGLDLSIPTGEVVAFLGPNGAGKTTALDLVLGLTEPTGGSVTVFGQAPRTAVRTGRVAAVLQTGGLLRDLTVRETVRMVASTYPEHDDVDAVLERAGLTRLARRKVQACSGGEQQRVRFALALLPRPDLLILDEPTTGMDVAARQGFWEAMRTEAGNGRTVLFATHYLEEADAFAHRIVMVAGGRIVADGTAPAIRARASGRQVSARVPAEQVAALTAALSATAGVDEVTERHGRVTVWSGDSDAVVRTLLLDWGAHDIEVGPRSLESAFLSITGERVDTAADVAARGGPDSRDGADPGRTSDLVRVGR